MNNIKDKENEGKKEERRVLLSAYSVAEYTH